LRPDGRPTFPEPDVADLPLDVLRKRLPWWRGTQPNLMASCPAHRDLTPSLAITERPDGTVLLHCHAGCPVEKVLDALGLKLTNLYPSGFARQFNDRRVELPAGKLAPRPFVEVVEPVIDHNRFRRIIKKTLTNRDGGLVEYAADLGVTPQALRRLGVGMLDGDAVFPERDNRERPVGICYRSRHGRRWYESGGKRGLTVPVDQPTEHGPLYVAEGATDVVALLSVGVRAIGRPAARSSALATLWLVKYLELHAPDSIVVVGDNDDPDSDEGVGEVAARDLANRLVARLRRAVLWGLPRRGFKDVRDQITAGKWDKGLRTGEGVA